MKKVLLLLIMIMAVIVNVSAETKEDFRAAEWIPNIYVSKVKDGVTHYHQARFIRKNSDDGIAYCIEPFEYMKENEKYNGYSDNYASKLGISESTWKQISLIAYYGYGYSKHTDNKWYVVTQIMIWKEIDKNADFYITETLNGSKTDKYNNEMNEIKTLVNNHNKVPSFANKSYNLSIDSTETITDSNGVLNSFNATTSDSSITLTKSGNNLSIKTSKETNATISFEKKFNNYNGLTIVFVDSSYQNIMTPGNVPSLKFNINVKANGGKLKITKVDADSKEKTPQGEGTLVGSVYTLYNDKGEVVDTLVIDENNEATSSLLPHGKYILKESKSMKGYLLDENSYEVTIDSKTTVIQKTLKNQAIKSTIEIYKYFDEKLESGISFEIYNNKGELIDTVITDENGSIKKELYYGTYKFHQLNTTKNYKCVDDFEVTIDETSPSVIRLDLKDEKFSSQVRITKKDKSTGDVIKEETVFKLYDAEKEEYIKVEGKEELKTEEGILKIEKLDAGKYILEEYEAPKGYKINNQKIEFEIDEDNEFTYEDEEAVFEIDVYDEIIEVEVPNTSQDLEENQTYIIDDKKKKLAITS